MGRGQPKFFRDPIHGYIEIENKLLRIIDSPFFQRLRRIKQLAFTDLVYHGAEHSRFGHSLGALALASNISETLNIRDKEKRNAFRLAALLHDIGHPPYSHAFEACLETPNSKWKHEDYTEAIIRDTEIGDMVESLQVNKDTVIKLIQGKYVEKPQFSYLNDLISSELDVDRLDFLLRDSYYCGVPYGQYDIQRLLLAIQKKGRQIVIDEKARHAAESFIMARFWMYTQVYTHHTRRAFDVMMRSIFSKDAMKEIDYPEPSKRRIHELLEYDDAWLTKRIQEVSEKKSKYCEEALLASALIERHPIKRVVEKIAYMEVDSKRIDPDFTSIETLENFKDELAKEAELSPELIFFDKPWKDLPFESKYRQYTQEKEGSAINILFRDGTMRDIAMDLSSLAYNVSKWKARVVRVYTLNEKRNKLGAIIAKKCPQIKNLIIAKN